ncbi:MAG: helix-turn-helix domain-containing protein [Thermoleophilia bacterium]
MTDLQYEYLPDDTPTFEDDLRAARRHPEYWSEKLKLDVADAVNEHLHTLRVSRAELARRMGTSPAFVTKILRGHHNWSLETLAKAGVALGLQWLLVPAPIEAQARVLTRLEFPDAHTQRVTDRLLTDGWVPADVPTEDDGDDERFAPAA